MNSAKVGYKDEAGANHQIANLLLNLASQRNQHGTDQPDVGSETEAMDLTKYRKPKSGREEKPAPATVVAKQPSPNSSLYSSMCSPFLLQNLLMQQMSPTPVVGQPSGIPLMAGQIVAALNSLLFTLHGLQDKGVEMNVQGQLSAIYTRLQEIVTMIEHAKKEPAARVATTKDPTSPPSQSELHKQLELVTSTKEAEEQRIGAQLEEYQRAIAGTATSATCFPQYPPASPLSSSMLRKQQKPSAPEVTESKVEVVDVQPATGTTEPASESRRVSRDSADEGPANKRMRVEEASSPASSPPSASRGARGGKGGKGIRNRVFCGDCAGCLKNDDCGSCRYCRDKTKFGGQNRLRQKCLHRRCLLDTHRRNGGSGPATTSEQGIYSGLELARLQQNSSSGDHSIFSLLGGGSAAGRVPTLASDEVEGKDENRDCREESSDRESGEQTQSRSNRWKAKHEAMLKQAGGEEGKSSSQQVFESSSLVITLNETTRREEGELEGSPQQSSAGPRMKSATSLDSREPARLTRRNMKPVLAV